jgi:beta-galactosidase
LLGTGQRSDHYLFTFPNVAFSPGEITAIAYDDNDNTPLATDSIRTAGAPVALSLQPITGPGGLQADGSDVALVDVIAMDANGRQCPTFNQRVDFSCKGPAIWRGGYNSGIPGSINQKYLNLECGINRVAVRSTLKPGDISVTATCPGLKSATVVIPSYSFEVGDGYSQTMPAMPIVALSGEHPDWSALAAATPPMTVTAAAENTANGRHFIQTFSYSGPTPLVHVEVNAADGRNAYCDRDYAFQNLPERLSGADWIHTADEDNLYAAADLMQIAAKAGTMVYVAYDAALPVPDWLQNQFHPTTFSFTLNGRPMKVFSLRLRTDESLTLGSNASSTQFKSANMYIVFARAGGQRDTANR